jgi:hypothetical protein
MYIDFFGKKILFIHIPKTGGSAIEEMFCRYLNIEFFKWPDYHEKYIWGSKNNLEYQHLTAKQIFDDLKILDTNEIDFIFTVVRNPYDRFVSEINWKYIIPAKNNKNLAMSNFFNDVECRPQYCHNISQVKFIDGYFDKIKIYKYEDTFDQIIKDLKTLCNITEEIEIKQFYVTVNKCISKSDISVEEKNKIINIYKNDFLNFNYVE